MTNLNAPFRFAVAATFTADPLRPFITFWGRELHCDFDVRLAPYNQVIQSLLDPASELVTNTHGVNVVLLRLKDLGSDLTRIENNLRHVAEELRAAPERLSVPLIVCLCPSTDPGIAGSFDKMETLLQAELDDTPGVQFMVHQSIRQLYPVDAVHSPEGEKFGRIPYTEAYFCALATALVRHAHSLFRAPYKLVALDCDNTLWQGICGEDGPENVVLDPPRRALHEFMLREREDGMLLALASKNNEEDVIETFRVHPEMPLQMRHFVTSRLNWDPKSVNLSSIAEQLGLGLDSFIFIDDNPKECAELQDALPEVLTLALPEDIERTPHFLNHVWAFDQPVVTEEDRKRSAYYEQAAEFGNEVRRARSMEEFMESLRLRVTVNPLTAPTLPRVAQLTQRTNQFNTTTIRRTETDIQALVQSGAEVLTVDASDRFGDYGLVGVMILVPGDDSLTLDSMLLSCRALGRGVEHRMLAAAAGIAVERGLHMIAIPFQPTAKNAPALQFLESIPFGERGSDSTLKLDPSQAAELTWSPQKTAAAPSPKPVKGPRPKHTVDYSRIARDFSTVPQILEAVRRGSGLRFETAMSDTERRLAAIWADLLETADISRESNFFELGGHSLAAVLLLMRIRETFDVELSIDDVYSGSLTLSDLAARIETAGVNSDEYAAILAEIESLSDEEARELLARESGQA